MSNHTPGPWIISKSFDDPDDFAIRTKEDDQCLAVVLESEGLSDEKEANARLIASSPKLLRSLEAILGVLNPDKDGGYFVCKEAEEIVNEAREAIKEVNPKVKTYTVISKYSSWVYDDIEAASEAEALSKADDLDHTDGQIGKVATWRSLSVMMNLLGEN